MHYNWVYQMLLMDSCNEVYFFLTQGCSVIIIAIQIHAYLSQFLLVLAKEAKEQYSEINIVGEKN